MKNSSPKPLKPADELFEQYRTEIFIKTDRLFEKLFVVQWLAGIVAALLIAPRTWAGQTSEVHIHVWAAIFIGAAITAFPIWMTRVWPGHAITRYVVAVAQMLMSALLIDLSGGRIETHFHVFGSLAILALYRDWKVLIPATVAVAADHFFRGIYFPYSVYGVLTASPWRSLEHAGWVIFEDIFLVIASLRSISEMRAIANRTAALEASERNFRQIFEEAPIGMAVLDLDERFTKANHVLCDLVGHTEQELRTRTPLDITYPEDLDKSKYLTWQMLNGEGRNRIEKRYVTKDGDPIWAARTGCIIRDEGGDPLHFLIMVEDISDRKRAEKALSENKQELEAALHANQLIMDNSQDVICTIDQEGRFLTVNAASEQLWGYKPDELLGRRYLDFVDPEDQSKTEEAAKNVRLTGKLTDFVNRYIRKDGAIVDVLWSATWSEEDKRHFCVAHDVTERSRIEQALREAKDEAERANRAKSEFLSRMSHELRTPLNAILGFGQLLERQKPTDTQKNRISYIMKAGHHLLDLINEVLDISRIEAGNLQLSVEPIHLDDAFSETLDLIAPLARERSISISKASSEAQTYVLADRQRFKQVLLNLLTNGVKYTPANGAVVVSYQLTKSDRVQVRITDTGPGIPPEKLSRLFMPFDRLDAERSGIEGTGLGLSLSRRLVEAMHGLIGVDSALGKGSSFWVELPLAQSPLERLSSNKPRQTETSQARTEKKRTILYIEDNRSNLTLIEQVLAEDPQTRLLSAMQGRLGIDLARQHSPDVVLLDLHLPDMPGWEVLSELQRNEATKHLPVIVISADATSRQINKLMAAGAYSYLTKPLNVDQFFKTIEKASNRTEATNGAVAVASVPATQP